MSPSDGVRDVYRVTPYDERGERPCSWQYGSLREARSQARQTLGVDWNLALVIERGVRQTAGCKRRWTPVEMWSRP